MLFASNSRSEWGGVGVGGVASRPTTDDLPVPLVDPLPPLSQPPLPTRQVVKTDSKIRHAEEEISEREAACAKLKVALQRGQDAAGPEARSKASQLASTLKQREQQISALADELSMYGGGRGGGVRRPPTTVDGCHRP